MAETLVLIPGLLCDEAAWAPLRAVLPEAAGAVVADITTQPTIEEMAADILAANPGPLAVAGHSLGARVALEMYRQAPGRIARLALLDTGTHPATEAEKPGRARRIALAHEKGMAALCDDWLPPMVHPDRHGDEALMAPLRAMVLAKTPEIHDRQIGALLARPDARPLLRQIACPTLVLVGRQDAWSPVAAHEEMAATIAGATLSVIEDAGHFAPAEQPEAVARALRDWLAR